MCDEYGVPAMGGIKVVAFEETNGVGFGETIEEGNEAGLVVHLGMVSYGVLLNAFSSP